VSQGHSRLLHEDEIATLFDEMAEEYDEITDLWYSWLFCRLHYFLVVDLVCSGIAPGGKCLDVGCGTGFQSILLNPCGHDVVGIDVAAALLEKAKHKNAERFLTKDFFKAPFPFVPKYSRRIRDLAQRYRGSSPPGKSEFRFGSATKLPFPNDSFDVINCSGSTLSFIEDYSAAIQEMARVLKRGGVLFLEVENKYNADLLWPVLDAKFLRGRLGYEQANEDVTRNLFSGRLENVKIDYPFSRKDGEINMPIWLFSSSKLLAQLSATGIAINRLHGIHAVTNLLPSVTLDESTPSPRLMRLFNILAFVEEIVSSWPIIRRLGCSLVIAGTKR
jgi:ubiquinone/menaquinone biosynthesis C-methylase UbiE